MNNSNNENNSSQQQSPTPILCDTQIGLGINNENVGVGESKDDNAFDVTLQTIATAECNADCNLDCNLDCNAECNAECRSSLHLVLASNSAAATSAKNTSQQIQQKEEKKKTIECLDLDVTSHIMDYLDLNTIFGGICQTSKRFNKFAEACYKTQFPQARRTQWLNKSPSFVSNLLRDAYKYKISLKNDLVQLGLTKSSFQGDFIVDILKTGMFYLGGSSAMLIAAWLQNKDINMEQFDADYARDFDFHCIGDRHNEQDVQQMVGEMLKKHLTANNVKCLIKIKKFVLDIEFEDPKFAKMQFVFQIKRDIDGDLEFRDLPITQFLFTIENEESVVYKTKLAQIALDTKINIVYDPISELTVNRIAKYEERGYVTVVGTKFGRNGHPDQRIISIFANNSSGKQIFRQYVDCKFKDIITISKLLADGVQPTLIDRKTIVTNEFNMEEQISLTVIEEERNPSNSLFIRHAHQLGLLITKTEISTKHMTSSKKIWKETEEKIRREDKSEEYWQFVTGLGLVSDMDKYQPSDFIPNFTRVNRKKVTLQYTSIEELRKKRHVQTKLDWYEYREDERKYKDKPNMAFGVLNYEKDLQIKYDNDNVTFPYYRVVSVEEFAQISTNAQLFFKEFNSYFLNHFEIYQGKDFQFHPYRNIAFPTKLEVSNCGSVECNGIYTFVRLDENKSPVYEREGDCINSDFSTCTSKLSILRYYVLTPLGYKNRWYLSAPDASKPNSNADVDYYDSLDSDEMKCPVFNKEWRKSSMDLIGRAPFPIVRVLSDEMVVERPHFKPLENAQWDSEKRLKDLLKEDMKLKSSKKIGTLNLINKACTFYGLSLSAGNSKVRNLELLLEASDESKKVCPQIKNDLPVLVEKFENIRPQYRVSVGMISVDGDELNGLYEYSSAAEVRADILRLSTFNGCMDGNSRYRRRDKNENKLVYLYKTSRQLKCECSNCNGILRTEYLWNFEIMKAAVYSSSTTTTLYKEKLEKLPFGTINIEAIGLPGT